MEFLKDEFRDQLAAKIDKKTGNIIIENTTFTPQQILEADKDAFEEVFLAWHENRRQDQLNYANEILDLFDNRDRFEQLKQCLLAQKVIPFVGAGMSMPSGYPSWKTFLKGLLKFSTMTITDFNKLILNGLYEELAQNLSDDISEVVFNENLNNTFGSKRLICGPVRYLPSIFNNSVVTTNFDYVIKTIYDDYNKSFDDTVTGLDAQDVPRRLANSERLLVHLHGKAGTNKGRVLLKNEYDRHYKGRNNLKKCITPLCNFTLLFIGCSLTIDRTIETIKQLQKKIPIGTMPYHYAFLQVESVKTLGPRKKELGEAHIFPIWYEGDHDMCIESLFLKLMEP